MRIVRLLAVDVEIEVLLRDLRVRAVLAHAGDRAVDRMVRAIRAVAGRNNVAILVDRLRLPS